MILCCVEKPSRENHPGKEMNDGESVLSLISSKLNYVRRWPVRREGRGINQKLALAEYNETGLTLSQATETSPEILPDL